MAQIEAIEAALPGTQLCKLPQGGHSPHRDAAQALNDAVAAFVNRVRG
jgi:pimeloyl-ACP methyl ester carboxylesterase